MMSSSVSGNVSRPSVPETGHQWRPTRQPIVLSEWHPERPFREVFTTVMNWTSYKPVVYGDRVMGKKIIEFMRFQELPSLVAPTVWRSLSMPAKPAALHVNLLAHKGWQRCRSGRGLS